MIEVRGLWKIFAGVPALRDLSFSVARGERVGLLGQNGAGKTTTMRVLTGYLPPSKGAVSVAGLDLETRARDARRKLGYLPESVPLPPELRVSEFLRFRAELKGIPRPKAEAERVSERTGLREHQRQIIGTLSKGFRQRVGLADALLGAPPLLILDEPTEGLDPAQLQLARALLRELAAEHTVLLSTHLLSEVEALCQRVLLLQRGALVADLRRGAEGAWGRAGEEAAPRRILARILAPPPELLDALCALPGVARAAQDGESFTLDAAPGHDPSDEIVRLAAARALSLRELRPARATLEELFLAAVSAPPSKEPLT